MAPMVASLGMKLWGLAMTMLAACTTAPAAPRHAPAPVDVPFNDRDPRYWEAQCSKGVGDRCYLLGGNYERGGDSPWGFFPQDYAKAASAYRRGCDAGDLDSCGAGASLMIFGKPTRDTEAGIALAKTTCDRGHADSCGLYGMARATWAESLTAYQEGLEFTERGCGAGGVRACSYLAGFRTKAFAHSPAPTTANGIRLGGSPEKMMQWCIDHGYEPEPSKDTVRCRTKDGFLACMGSYRSGQLVAVFAGSRLSGGADRWTLAIKDAIRTLSDLYGTPSELTVLGRACARRSVQEQLQCLEADQIKLDAAWAWESGLNVSASVDFLPGGEPILVISTARMP
jgi:hypothetical protein